MKITRDLERVVYELYELIDTHVNKRIDKEEAIRKGIADILNCSEICDEIRIYQEKLMGLVNRADKLIKYPASRLGYILDALYDAIGDEFPLDLVFD